MRFSVAIGLGVPISMAIRMSIMLGLWQQLHNFSLNLSSLESTKLRLLKVLNSLHSTQLPIAEPVQALFQAMINTEKGDVAQGLTIKYFNRKLLNP
jgi:hypothetical protein